MNMFMLQTRPQWGFLVGAGTVGIPAILLVLATDIRIYGLAWMGALTAALVGGGWAAILSLRRNSTNLWRAALLGSYAWMATLLVLTPIIPYLLYWVIPVLPIAALFGLAMGAAAGGLMRWAGIRVAPAQPVVRRRKVARLADGRRIAS